MIELLSIIFSSAGYALALIPGINHQNMPSLQRYRDNK